MKNNKKRYQKIEKENLPDICQVFSGWKVGDWALCLHCGRAYKIGEYRLIDGLQMCPYEGCDGDTVFDPVHYSEKDEPQRDHVYLW